MILEKEREEVTSEAERLADSVSNEAAPVETAPRKMVKCPSKTGINMNQREKRTGQVLTLVIGLAVILLMAGLVARFGVMEQYQRLSEAQSAYGEVHSQLAACQEKLTDYELVLTEYRSCSLDGMTEGEDQLITVSRQAVLDLVEGIMMPRGKVISVNILDDTADVEMSGMSLDRISAMFTVIEAEPIVRSVELNMAATEEHTASALLNFSVRINLGSEQAVEQ